MDLVFNLKFFSFHRKIFIGREWVRFCIVMLAVMLSVTVAYWGSYRILTLLMATLVGIAGVIILLKQPNLGFILIFLGGIFVPFSGPAGVNATVGVVALLIGVWLMDMLVVKREFRFINSKALLPVVIMLAISAIAFGMGQIPWFVFANQAPLDAQAGGFTIFFLSLGGMLVAAHLIQDIKWLKIIVWTFIGLGTLYVFGRLTGLPFSRFYHRGFTAGSMFWTWLVALAFAQAIFNTKLKISARVFLYGVVLVTMFVAYVQGNDWKSGWVPPLVAIGLITGLKYKRLMLLAIPLVLIVVAYLAIDLIASDEYSWGTRVDAWIIVLEISKVSPLLGMGFSNYYWYTPLFPIRGWRVSFNSHSQFVDLIAQVGILGLLCFLWIFFEFGRLAWRLAEKDLPDGFARAYAYGILGGLAGSLMAAFLVDWILPFVYNIGFNGFRASILFWIFLGGLVSIEQIFLGKTKSSVERSTT